MKTRCISAAIGIAIGIAILMFSNTPIFPLAVGLIAAGSVYEFLAVCGMKKYPMHFGGCLVFALVMPFLSYYNVDYTIRYILSFITVLVMFIGYLGDHKKLPFEKLCVMISVTMLMTLSLTCIVSLKHASEVHGVIYVVMALMSSWVPDGGAYFVGSAIGKTKMCPDISPKKTIEGAIGGIVVSAIVFVIFCFIYQQIMASKGVIFSVNYLLVVIMSILCAMISMVGDLAASLLKRENEIKDFGNLMPGHGGMVDRFDSVYLTLPF